MILLKEVKFNGILKYVKLGQNSAKVSETRSNLSNNMKSVSNFQNYNNYN